MNQKRKRRQLPHLYSKSYYFGVGEWPRGKLPLIKKKEIEYAQIKKGDKVLDIGCGRGDVLLACAQKGAIPYGIDFSNDAVELTKETLGKYLKKGQVIQANALSLPFPSNTFDKCICGDVIEHMTFSQAKKCLEEAQRVLKSAGILVIHTSPNTLFVKTVYPLSKLFLKFFGKKKLAERLERDIYASERYHVDEYNFFNFKKIIESVFGDKTRVWIDKDILRPGSRYYAELHDHPLVKLLTPFLSKLPLIYFFGNDFFAVCQKR